MSLGVCAACGDPARREFDGRDFCYACFMELAYGEIRPAIAWLLYGNAWRWRRDQEAELVAMPGIHVTSEP